MENVYPRLYLYCKQRGYDFRMVDLRRGVGNPIAEHHDTVQLHVENLQQCLEIQGPNFIVRYHELVLFNRTIVQNCNNMSDDEFMCDLLICWSVVCRTEI